MFVRNLLLALGVLSLLGGLVLSILWLRQIGNPPSAPTQTVRQAVLVPSHAITTGALLRPEDMTWKDASARDIRPGSLLRGQVDENEFVGSIARRDFAAGEPIITTDLVRPNERQFLAAVLKPGTRAVSISVDAPQGAAGLILPGDQVDVILAQTFQENAAEPNRRTVAETVLRNIRVIAIDQTLSAPQAAVPARPAGAGGLADSRTPRTVTFEVTEAQAERLVVASQLGRLQLSVRPLEASRSEMPPARPAREATWAADVSPALNELGRRTPAAGPRVGIENAIRRPPAASEVP